MALKLNLAKRFLIYRSKHIIAIVSVPYTGKAWSPTFLNVHGMFKVCCEHRLLRLRLLKSKDLDK